MTNYELRITKVGIIGAGGYAGRDLVIDLLLRHPKVKVVWLMSEEAHKGKKISELYPHYTGRVRPGLPDA